MNIIAFIYVVASMILIVYASNFYYLLYLSKKGKKPNRAELKKYPPVTVQLPIFNEQYVVRRLIDAVCAFNYPKEMLHIQVLDDSTDETRDVCRELVDAYKIRGFDIEHIHREDRTGYKAGALQNGLNTAKGEFIAIFDSDFIPHEDFLIEMLPYLQKNVGMAQARWGHVNEQYSPLTKAQSLSLDAHFLIEQTGRSRNGLFMNFNGTAGIWRKEAIIDAGGWSQDTLAEDTDLSYRAQLKGWKLVFVEDVTCPAELPVQINAFKRQQYRWSKGSLECGLKHSRRIIKAGIPMRTKIQSFLHLTRHMVHPLLIIQLITLPMLMYTGYKLVQFFAVFFLLFLYPPIYYYTIKRLKETGVSRLSYYPYLSLVGIGISVTCTKALLNALIRKREAFLRTPKFAVVSKKDRWSNNMYRLPFTRDSIFEFLLGAYALFAIIIAINTGFYLFLPYLLLIMAGFFYVSLSTVMHSRVS